MKARVYNADKDFLFESKAIYKRDEEAIHLRTDEDIRKFGDEFFVFYTDDNQGMFDFRCTYDDFERDNLQYIFKLKIAETLKSVQRRQDVKVKTFIPVNVVLLEYNDTVKVDPETQKAVKIRAWLRDISAGGIMLDTDIALDVNQKLLIPFDKGATPILVTAQVIREQPYAGRGRLRYGCRFVDLNYGKESVIREYVFRLQLAGKNKARYPDEI